MSTYVFLSDHYIGNVYYQAGTTAQTADVGGTLPTGWVPTAYVDPQDAAAAQAFFNAGPQFPTLIRMQWQSIVVPKPITYWKLSSPGSVLTADATQLQLVSESTGQFLTSEAYNRSTYSLTGLGANLGTVSI